MGAPRLRDDDDGMSETSLPPAPPPAEPPPTSAPPPGAVFARPPLRRSRDDRVLAGVCGGFGRYAGVDPVVFRVSLAVLTVFGGAGLLVYVLAWLLIPEDGRDDSALTRFLGGRRETAAVLAVVLAVIGAAVFFGIAVDGLGVPGLVTLAAVTLLLVYVLRRDPGAPGVPMTAQPTTSAPTLAGPPAQGPTTAAFAGSTTRTYVPGGEAGVGGGTPVGGWSGSGAGGTSSGGAWTGGASWPAAPPPPRAPRSVLPGLTLSLAAITVGVLVALDLVDGVDIGAQAILAGALLVVGLGLLVGAWFGRSRSLIAAAIPLALVLTAVAAVDVPVRGGVGERIVAPTSLAQVDSPYRLGMGDLRLDLRELPVAGGQVPIEASVGVGQLLVLVPADAGLEVTTHVHVGDIVTPDDRDTGGFDTDRTYRAAPQLGSPTYDLDLQVGIGQIEVRRVAS